MTSQPCIKNRSISVNTIRFNELSDAHLRQVLSLVTQNGVANYFVATAFVAEFEQALPDDAKWFSALKTLFAEYGLMLIGISTHHTRPNPAALTQAGLAHIPAGLAKSTPQNTTPTFVPTPIAPMIIDRPIRSGQRIYAENRDMIIIGTVNAGAEVIADGNIIIFGALRGRAFAGARGNERCFIYAHQLHAELIAIAGQYQNKEQLNAHDGQQQTLIRLSEDETMIYLSLL